ncbi:TonB-dependent siderophore receptor [Methylobacterium radiotolerans]|jgi:iron complex outermembrane recepter protein|uniref:TonB-dependent siderophore receptor n=1 Tax=Methylobacterium TaxID=407 RepID=UPI0005E9B33B|nr:MULTISPECIES: TonB-dependent siderophore receptor [Methylobacterium]KZC00452.1 Ferrichrome-iron receptor [Methylobacterium radiotolerans]MBN6818879.1 TonB-dependent siderophore receptor [Methylobacterium organophilum]OXE43094.1 TonB-dependent siderophore receptor [Methylobacterium radiotolerans]GAN46555.1 TonB-dependent siderophore receptor [Methylobacterium sp. ME121]
MSYRSLLTLLLATTALAGPARAQDGSVQLNEISVEAASPGNSAPGLTGSGGLNVSGGDGGTASTSGGGGGPSGITGYTARVATTATKTNTPLIEVPQSVSVVTREQLNDRNVQTFTDAVNYVPGAVSARSGFDPRFDQIFIRGFDVLTNQGIYRDGLRVIGTGFAYPKSEPYGAEALTILRGPASGLYGLGSPGGILDITTKRPVFAPFGEVQFQAGSFDRFQGNFDVGGPIEGSGGTMAYRLTGVRREAGTFIGLGTTDDQLYLAPAFTWKPSADTTFTFLSEFQVTNTPAATFFYNDPGFRVSKFYQGDPRFIGLDQTQYRVGYAFEHFITPDLIFRQNFRHYGLFLSAKYVDINNINEARTIGTRDTGYIREGLVQQTLDNQLEARFATGPVAHTVVGGVDYARYSLSARFGFGLAPDLNLVTRNYGQQFIPTPPLAPASRQSQDQIGVYLQDQAKFGNFILTLNGRHDWVFQNNYATPDSAVSRQDNSAFTGRVGLGYVLAPGLVPYASYATTFTPQVGIDRNGQAFKPATGDQIEAGVKYLIPGTNIQTAFAGFDINQSNILIPDAGNLAFQTAGGAVRSTGFEAEATANLAPGTNLTIAYTHVDIRFVNSVSATGQPIAGNRVSGIPSDTYASFLTYAFPPSSALRGLQIGGGIRFIGSSFADDQNTVRNTAVTLYDALVAYDFAALDPKYKGFRAQINAYNIFDRNYTTCSFGFCNFNQPARVIGSLIYRW